SAPTSRSGLLPRPRLSHSLHDGPILCGAGVWVWYTIRAGRGCPRGFGLGSQWVHVEDIAPSRRGIKPAPDPYPAGNAGPHPSIVPWRGPDPRVGRAGPALPEPPSREPPAPTSAGPRRDGGMSSKDSRCMRRMRKDATKVWHNPELNTFSRRGGG